jgi:hypothetical protein
MQACRGSPLPSKPVALLLGGSASLIAPDTEKTASCWVSLRRPTLYTALEMHRSVDCPLSSGMYQ